MLGLVISGFSQEIRLSNYKWEDGFYKIYDSIRTDSVLILKHKEDSKYYQIDSFPSVLVERIKKISINDRKNKEKSETVYFEFTDWGAQQFRKLTEEMNGKKIGFVIDNELVFVGTVFGIVPGGTAALTSAKKFDELEGLIEKIKKKIYKGQ